MSLFGLGETSAAQNINPADFDLKSCSARSFTKGKNMTLGDELKAVDETIAELERRRTEIIHRLV
jgi:hypothetical protein